MATLADELDYAMTGGLLAAAGDEGLPPPGFDVPDIVKSPRLLRVVPFAGDGPDPLDADASG